MHARAVSWPDGLVTSDSGLDHELEDRLIESASLVFRVAYGVLRHREDAEDVAQEALAKAYRRFRQLRDRQRFRAWLVRLTWRLAIDRRRSESRRANREAAVGERPASVHTPLDEVSARERAARLWAAIDALPERLRLVVVLAGIEGHDLKEVARLLSLPDGTVKSRMFEARRRLRLSLRCSTIR